MTKHAGVQRKLHRFAYLIVQIISSAAGVGCSSIDDDVIKWKHFSRYWPFVRGIYRSPVNSPHKGQWRGALMFSLSVACINGRVNNREAGNLRRHRTHYDVIVMDTLIWTIEDKLSRLVYRDENRVNV